VIPGSLSLRGQQPLAYTISLGQSSLPLCLARRAFRCVGRRTDGT